MKIIAICIVILASVCVARSDGSDKTIAGTEEGVPEVTSLEDSEKKSSDGQKKREAGYSYPRPSESSSRPRVVETWGIRGRPSGKTSVRVQGPIVRPFVRYGPPRQSSTSQRDENRGVHVTVNTIGLVDDRRHQRVPSAIREHEFVGGSPIASQNNIPFGPNSANYLPPRNQRLPVETTPLGGVNGFPHQNGHHQDEHHHQQQQQNHQHQQHHQSIRTNQGLPVHQINSQISDGVNFLSQNSQAIEQLYQTPAANINYEPIPEQLPVRDLQSLEFNDPQNTGSYQETGDFRLPGYASGVLDREALGSVKALEKDRLINELRQSLVDAQQPRNPFPETDNRGRQNERPDHRGCDFVPVTPGYQYTSPPTTSGSSPVPSTSSQETQTTTGATSVSATSTTNNNFQFPGFGGFLPVSIDYRPYGTGLLASATSGHSSNPTQFGIPIPQGTTPQKPETSGTSNNQPLPVPVHPVPLHPVVGSTSVNGVSIQPSFPLVPAVGQTNVQPIQPAINPLLVKPIKPLYPVYYYPNVYQFQKPLATVPWNYAPSYSPIRPDQAWK